MSQSFLYSNFNSSSQELTMQLNEHGEAKYLIICLNSGKVILTPAKVSAEVLVAVMRHALARYREGAKEDTILDTYTLGVVEQGKKNGSEFSYVAPQIRENQLRFWVCTEPVSVHLSIDQADFIVQGFDDCMEQLRNERKRKSISLVGKTLEPASLGVE